MTKSKILSYIPIKLRNHVLGEIDYWKNDGEHYYCIDVCFDLLDENGEQTNFIAHGVQELKFACKEILNGRRGCIL